MSDKKQIILSELKSKITQFKSKIKSHKSIDEEKVEDEIVLKLPLNKNINQNNKENIDINNNIIMNKPIKNSKIERSNSIGISNIISNKKFIDFNVDKMLEQTKNYSCSKTNINLDEYNNNNNKNKTFINLDLNTKKVYSRTERNKIIYNRFNNEYLDKYEINYSEPNISSYKNSKDQNKCFNYNYDSNDILIPLSKDKNKRDIERFSAKPEIRPDVSRYNLNFMMEHKNTFRKNSAKLFEGKNDDYSMNIKNILYSNSRQNSNIINGLNSKYLKSSCTTYNYNSFNCFNNFNKGNLRKNFLNVLENNKSSNSSLNMNDIQKVKYMIQNLSNDEIKNMPISVFKEMKDLYDLIFRKFIKNNYI